MMKRLVLTIMLASLAAFDAGGLAASRARECPKAVVSCPDTVRIGEPFTFTASIEDAPADAKLTYNWSVSPGTISSGQGTSAITVDTTSIGGNETLTATVEVGGFPEGCGRKASCTTAFPDPLIGCGFDEYGNITFDDEKARLDNFAIELMNDPTAQGYLICYGGRRGYAGEAARRCARARGYISGVRGIAPERLVTVDGGFREELNVKVVIVPAGAKPPEPSPSVDPQEVVIIKHSAARRARRR
jgi:PKD domain-containing protein